MIEETTERLNKVSNPEKQFSLTRASATELAAIEKPGLS